MPSRDDLLHAKSYLSGRLLRGAREGRAFAGAAVRVADAVAASGRNVHAVGIGRKVVNGVETQELCVRVYVVQKLPETLLAPRFRIPETVDGVPTDVIESPPAVLQAKKKPAARPKPATARSTSSKPTATKPTATKTTAVRGAAAEPQCSTNRFERQRPIVAGISAGHFNVTAGTIAYFCRSTRTGDNPGDVFVLSNNHIFADVNRGQAGDDVLQPGAIDGGGQADRFADLARWVTLHLDNASPNRVDAAIARLRAGVTHRVELCSIGVLTGTARASLNTRVRKHGRKTGYTEGEVTDDSYDAQVQMDPNDPSSVALFEGQLRIEPTAPYSAIARQGDSGSLFVLRDEPRAVGLFFAGPPSGEYGVANVIGEVLSALEIELL